MAIAPFLIAIWALLLTPGPTNTLMALAGAQGGWRSTLRLVPAELAAYLLIVLPAALIGADAMAQWPDLARVLKLGAALWIFYLAIILWRVPSGHVAAQPVGIARLFITTLLNPKGLVVGLVLLPSPHDPLFGPHLLLFGASVILAASVWAGLGAQAGQGESGGDARWLRRIAGSWLALLSGGLVLGAMTH